MLIVTFLFWALRGFAEVESGMASLGGKPVREWSVVEKGFDAEVEQCLAFNLRRATRLVGQHYDGALRPHGLLVTQFNLLAALSLAGPITVTELAAAFAIDRTTLTRNLRVLTDKGWVSQQAGTDRRTRVVEVTAEGRRAADAALPAWRSAHRVLVERLGDDFEATLATLNSLEAISKESQEEEP